MRALNVLLAFLISLAVVLLVLEGGLRLLGQGPGKKINRPDTTVGWVKRADFSFRRKTKEFDVTLETNALGLRDDAMDSPAKPADTFRVLCLGDSFVLGYAVEREDLFVDQLEQWWRAEGRDIEVINAGTEGYSTDQEVAWFLTHGQAFEPDLVLLFPYENDIWWNGREDYYKSPKPRFSATGELEGTPLPEAPWYQNTAIARLLRGAPKEERLDVGGHSVLADFAPVLRDSPPGLGDAEARTGGALKALKEACVEVGAPLVVFPIPSHSVFDESYATNSIGPGALGGVPRERWNPDRPLDFFLAQARTLDLPALDARESLRGAAAASDDELYYEVDFHLTPAGNRAFATFIKTSLDDMGVFPEAQRASTPLAALPEITIGERSKPTPKWPFFFLGLWTVLGIGYVRSNPDEKAPLAFLSVGALLAVVFAVAIGFTRLLAVLPPDAARWVGIAAVLGILGFVLYKLGRRIGTILELMASFTLRGHWYLMPLVMVLLTVGSLLVVAASSPLVAPFIYTLF